MNSLCIKFMTDKTIDFNLDTTSSAKWNVTMGSNGIYYFELRNNDISNKVIEKLIMQDGLDLTKLEKIQILCDNIIIKEITNIYNSLYKLYYDDTQNMVSEYIHCDFKI